MRCNKKEIKKPTLVFGPCTLCLQQCLHLGWHTLEKVLNKVILNLPPLLLQGCPHLIAIAQERALGLHPPVQIFPYMFNDIHVWTTGGPIQNIELCLLKPILSDLGSVLQITVLLKVDILLVDPKVLQGPQDVVIEDLSVEGAIHIAFNVNNVTHT
jgi:hypothetical protein